MAGSIVNGQLLSADERIRRLETGGLGNQAAIDARIKAQLEAQLQAQQNAITNNIVKQSANVPFRDPSSYFYGYQGNPFMAQGEQKTTPINVASPEGMSAQEAYKQALAKLMSQYNLLG